MKKKVQDPGRHFLSVEKLDVNLYWQIDQTLLGALLQADVGINHACGGGGTCGTCRIFVEQNQNLLEPRNEIESEMAQDRNFKPNERLACQILAPAEGPSDLERIRISIPKIEI